MPFDPHFDDDGINYGPYGSPDRGGSPDSFKSALEEHETESLNGLTTGHVSSAPKDGSYDTPYEALNEMPNGSKDVEMGEAPDAADHLDLVTSDLLLNLPRPPRPALSNGTSSTLLMTRDGTPASGTEQKPRARHKESRSGMRIAATRSSGVGLACPIPLKPSKPAGGTSKPSRRPNRPPTPPPRHVYNELEPQFLRFFCEWKDCPAELQNFETLQRHVFKVHGASEVCMWGRCAHAPYRPSLVTDEDFRNHMHDNHLTPFVWHTGDGPKNGCGVPKVVGMRGDTSVPPPYLFDARGIQVTPSVRNQRYETQEELRERRRRLARLRLERDENAPAEEPMTEAEMAEMPSIMAKHPRLRWMT